MPTDETIPESTYPELKAPSFESDIPPHLLANASESDKYVLEQLSIVKQFIPWSVEAQLLTHSAVRRTNGRVISLEGWRSMFKSWWGLTIGAFSVIGGVASIIEVWQYVLAHWPK